jgi:MFS family permease
MVAGFSASLVGIGLARFCYAPLLPAVIQAGWFAPSAAAYLGAANFLGYLAGALLGQPIAARAGTTPTLRAMMLLASLGFFACAWPLSFTWFFLWRFAAGVAGAVLMVLAPPTVLARVPPARRGFAGGMIFTGVGLGIAASGTLVPMLLRLGVAASWIGLGAVALLLTALTWRGWPQGEAPAPAAGIAPASGLGVALAALFAAYALDAIGVEPHMVFLVDFVARGLGRGMNAGAFDWVLFGLGAVSGPPLAGAVADRIGAARALRLSLAVQAVMVGLLGVTDAPAAVIASSLVIGAFVPGIVPIALARLHELLPHAPARQRAWSIATVAWALGQSGAAYG